MTEYGYLHECETVVFQLDRERPLKELLPVFKKQGFTRHDDVVSLDRRDQVLPWQHSSIVEVEVRHRGQEVFGFKRGLWDTLLLRYLFASLPFELSEEFLRVVEATQRELAIVPSFRGQPSDVGSIRTAFDAFRDALLSTTGEAPGSELLTILIRSTYPRT